MGPLCFFNFSQSVMLLFGHKKISATLQVPLKGTTFKRTTTNQFGLQLDFPGFGFMKS